MLKDIVLFVEKRKTRKNGYFGISAVLISSSIFTQLLTDHCVDNSFRFCFANQCYPVFWWQEEFVA